MYCDPPYHEQKTESYNAGDWNEAEHHALAAVVREWAKRGCRVAVSYMATAMIEELYADWRCFEFRIKHTAGTRKIRNRVAEKRRGETHAEPVVRELLFCSWL